MRLTRVRDTTALSPSSCIRSRRSGAALSSRSTSYHVSEISPAAARSRSIERIARLWARSTARQAATGSRTSRHHITYCVRPHAIVRCVLPHATIPEAAQFQREEPQCLQHASFNGIELPPAGTWTVDPGHAEVGFVGRHFGLTKVRGRFTGVEATVVVGDDITASTVEVVIDMASVSSGDQSRDDHLRSADFFDVEHHPRATFRSTARRHQRIVRLHHR